MLTLPVVTSLVAPSHPRHAGAVGFKIREGSPHEGTVSPREPFVYQHLQTAAQSALARQDHASWGQTGCLLDFKRGDS